MEPDEWLKQHAPGYLELDANERTAIKDFVLIWSFFEALVLNTWASSDAIARACDRLARRGPLKLEPFHTSLAYFSNRYFDGTSFTPEYAGLYLDARDRPLVERVLANQTNDPAEVLTGLLIIIYRLRNNLVHGRKWQFGIKGQLANFRNASQVLMTFTEL